MGGNMTTQPTERKMVEERIKEFNRHQRVELPKMWRVPVLIPLDVAIKILKLAETTSIEKVLYRLCGEGYSANVYERATRSNDIVLRKVKDGEIDRRDVFSITINYHDVDGLCKRPHLEGECLPEVLDRRISRMTPKAPVLTNWEDQI
jgi:hypothetical protein